MLKKNKEKKNFIFWGEFLATTLKWKDQNIWLTIYTMRFKVLTF